ncbi:MAG: transposase [Firmicutes bacterium]|nr:transposase [Bacillota bacterium]
MGYDAGVTRVRDLVRHWRAALGSSDAMVPGGSLHRPTWKDVRWAVLCPLEHRKRGQEELAETFLALHPDLREAHDLVWRFWAMLRDHAKDDLEVWIEQARLGRFHSFKRLARTCAADLAAIGAATELPWSTGRVEGHITRVQLIKQIGYGRAGLALLRAASSGYNLLLSRGVIPVSLPEVLLNDVENPMCEFCLVSVAESPWTGYPVAFRLRGNSSTHFELYPTRGRRPKDRTRVLSARFGHDPEHQVWIPYRADGSSRWRVCVEVQPSAGFASLLAEVYAD